MRAVIVLFNKKDVNILIVEDDKVLAGIEKIKAKMDDSAVLVVTHLAIIRVLLLHMRKMDLNLYKTIAAPNGKIFEMEDSELRG